MTEWQFDEILDTEMSNNALEIYMRRSGFKLYSGQTKYANFDTNTLVTFKRTQTQKRRTYKGMVIAPALYRIDHITEGKINA